MVVARPSALCDRMQQVASGLPSRIQDFSIGRGVSPTVSLAISISERDIEKLNPFAINSGPRETRAGHMSLRCGRLSFPYARADNPPQKVAAPVLLRIAPAGRSCAT